MARRWSLLEDEVLIDLAGAVKYAWIADALESRTTNQVRRRMQYLGIRTRSVGRTAEAHRRRLERSRQWKYENRAIYAELEAERRARTGKPDYTREEIFDRDGWVCQLCFGEVPRYKLTRNHPLEPTIDHILALADGGLNVKENTQLAHRVCNSRKRPERQRAA